MPRTLFPSGSSGGDQRQIPITLGTTTMSAPETPLLAGSPMENANSPEKSYMPHEYMSERHARTVLGRKTRIPVVGQTPPFASVAATTDMRSHVDSMEQHWK